MPSLIKLDMESSLVIELKIALVDIGYFAGLTPAGNSQFNLGKSRDEFKSKMKQGTWWTPITLHKEDNSFNMDGRTPWNKEEEDECHKIWSTIKACTHRKWMNKSIGLTKCQRSKSKNMAWQKDEKERVQSRRQEAHEQLKMRG